MSIDPVLERAVLAEMAFRGRRARQPTLARAVAEGIHRGNHDLLDHLLSVARAVPPRFRRVAWLHHARDVAAGPRDLASVGLTASERAAIELLSELDLPTPGRKELQRLYAIAREPGGTGHIARVVAGASLWERLAHAPAAGEDQARLRLLTDPRFATCR
jgi:hypothetical protein